MSLTALTARKCHAIRSRADVDDDDSVDVSYLTLRSAAGAADGEFRQYKLCLPHHNYGTSISFLLFAEITVYL